MRSSEATASPAMSPFLAVRVSTERSQHVLRIGLAQEPVGGEIVDRDGNHEPALGIVGSAPGAVALVTLERRSRSAALPARTRLR